MKARLLDESISKVHWQKEPAGPERDAKMHERRSITMKTNAGKPKDIDDYIARFATDVQAILEKIRQTIRRAAPKAEEAISYQIPTFKLNGDYLIYFAAFKKHVSIYPAPRGVEEFKKELTVYEGGKGTVQFPLDKPIPYDLIKRIVKFRAKGIMEKSKSTSRKR